MNIHPTAIIDPAAELHESVIVGPYVVIESGVRIGANSEIKAHSVISGPTRIGGGNIIGPFASIGAPPQDMKFKGEPSRLTIGDHNVIREYVSIHRGTASGHNETMVGSDNMLMAYVHVAHDCTVGDHVVMANAATLAGHVAVEDHVILGGLVAVHQFTRIGAHSYIGGVSGISLDVAPYVIVTGIRRDMRVSGINKVGLRRRGFDAETIRQLELAYRIIFRSPDLLLQEALDRALTEYPECEPVRRLVDFFRQSKQGVVRSANGKS